MPAAGVVGLVFVSIILLLLPILSAEGATQQRAACRHRTLQICLPVHLDIFFRAPFLEVLSGFFDLPVTKSIVVVPQKVTEGPIFRSLFLYGY